LTDQVHTFPDVPDADPEPPLVAAPDRSVERRCFVTRSTQERDRLIRFVVDPDGMVVPDVDERLPGRGMWLSAGKDVLNRAIEKRLFGRAAGRSVRIADGLADQVEGLLTRRFYDALGLSRRAGNIVMGFEKVQAWLVSSKAALLLQAADGAEDGRRKLRHLALETTLIVAGSREDLGSAVGRESLVHAALPPGTLAERVLRDAVRLAGFRADIAVEEAGRRASERTEPKGTTETP
jgi:predicted RNA-binding protein YlxR (DUF448 family)/ribosomal protein L30E